MVIVILVIALMARSSRRNRAARAAASTAAAAPPVVAAAPEPAADSHGDTWPPIRTKQPGPGAPGPAEQAGPAAHTSYRPDPNTQPNPVTPKPATANPVAQDRPAGPPAADLGTAPDATPPSTPPQTPDQAAQPSPSPASASDSADQPSPDGLTQATDPQSPQHPPAAAEPSSEEPADHGAAFGGAALAGIAVGTGALLGAAHEPEPATEKLTIPAKPEAATVEPVNPHRADHGDARDRLLQVLLTDPKRALRAADELLDCQDQLDRLSRSVDYQKGKLAGVARRLRAAGLTPAQVARLAGMGEGELASLLAAHAPTPSARPSERPRSSAPTSTPAFHRPSPTPRQPAVAVPAAPKTPTDKPFRPSPTPRT